MLKWHILGWHVLIPFMLSLWNFPKESPSPEAELVDCFISHWTGLSILRRGPCSRTAVSSEGPSKLGLHMVCVIRHFMRSISMETKEKQRLVMRRKDKLSFDFRGQSRCLDLGLKTSLDGRMRTGSGSLMNFLWFAVWMFLVMASGALMNFLSGLKQQGWTSLVDNLLWGFLWSSCPVTQPVCPASEKRQLHFSVMSSQEDKRKRGMLPTDKTHKVAGGSLQRGRKAPSPWPRHYSTTHKAMLWFLLKRRIFALRSLPFLSKMI